MMIASLEQMEKIVSNNKELAWDGWTVVKLKPTDVGSMATNAIRIEGEWFLQTRFELTSTGWNIPNNLIG